MWNKIIYCEKCKVDIQKYDSDSINGTYYDSWKYCPMCGNKVIRKSFSPDF